VKKRARREEDRQVGGKWAIIFVWDGKRKNNNGNGTQNYFKFREKLKLEMFLFSKQTQIRDKESKLTSALLLFFQNVRESTQPTIRESALIFAQQ
jgi:hypothetical protein